MFKAKKVLAVLLSLAMLTGTGLACTGYNALDLIKADSVTFQKSSGLGPQTCYSVPIDFDVPYSGFQTALSISNFNGLRSRGYDYSVRGGQKGNSKTLSISLLIDDADWTKLTVSYLVTARADVFAGTFLVDAFNQYDCGVTGNQELSFSANLPAVPSNFDYEVRVFIAGIEVKDDSFDFSFKKATFNSRTGALEVKATSNAFPHIENIHLSFVLYRTNVGFAFNVIPATFVKNEDYVFAHTSSFSANGPEILALTIDSDRVRCTGRGCADRCCNIQRCTSAGGILTGKDCLICGKNERIENKQCVPNCRENEDYDADRDDCKCRTGFSRPTPGDICRWNCGLNEIWSNGRCVCKDNHSRIGDACIPCPSFGKIIDGKILCDRDYYFHPRRYSCDFLTCPANSSPQWQDKDDKWVCKCDANYYWNSKTSTCQFVSQCPPYSKLEFSEAAGIWRCVCDRDYLWNDKRYACENPNCPPNSTPQLTEKGWSCVCNQNYYLNDDKKCDYLAPCPPNSKPGFVDRKIQCICDKDYYWNSVKGICDYLPTCGPYASAVFTSENVWRCVCKNDCYSSGNGCKPLPICPGNSKFNPVTEVCECTRNGEYLIDGVCRICAKNEEYSTSSRRCVCKNGFTFIGGRCVQICSDLEDQVDDGCVCKSHCMVGSNRKCTPCPVNSKPTPDRSACICIEGFISDGTNCVPVQPKCPEGMERINGKCVCKDGYYMEAGICKQTPKCPVKTRWNQDKLICECAVAGEYMINGLCTSCKANEGWNGKQCACTTGYFKINGVCVTCDPNSYYTGKDCACNIGFYGDGKGKCNKCHSSCGKCLGPRDDQCTMCSDVSYNLVKKGDCGVCTRNSACPVGLYSEKGECKPCSSYCSACQSESVCKTCISGFQLNEMEYENVKYSYCVEICGDGKRFELDCDDGNTKNGDGCNENCQVETGWHCQGGSSIKASTCVSYTPSRSFVTLTGSVHAFGKIVQGIRLSYIPPALTANDCMNCHKLLWVRVISSSVVPGVRVNYLPKSQYQFLAEFDFNGLFAIPVFTISVQINPDFVQYFSEADLAQIEVKAIDPAVLAKHDKEDVLLEDEIDPTKIKVSDKELKDLFPDKK